MLIEGYDGGPLVAGEPLVARPGFWSNHLLGWCGVMGAERPGPEWFGEDGADVDALSEVLLNPQRWPVLRVPLEGNGEMVVVYCNLEGDCGVDYLSVQPGHSRARRIAGWEGDRAGGVLGWGELADIVDTPLTTLP